MPITSSPGLTVALLTPLRLKFHVIGAVTGLTYYVTSVITGLKSDVTNAATGLKCLASNAVTGLKTCHAGPAECRSVSLGVDRCRRDVSRGSNNAAGH